MAKRAMTMLPMTKLTMPNKRTCRLQPLQTADGHHGTFASNSKPMFPNKPMEPRSSSSFFFPQLRQVNTGDA